MIPLPSPHLARLLFLEEDLILGIADFAETNSGGEQRLVGKVGGKFSWNQSPEQINGESRESMASFDSLTAPLLHRVQPLTKPIRPRWGDDISHRGKHSASMSRPQSYHPQIYRADAISYQQATRLRGGSSDLEDVDKDYDSPF